MSRPLSPCVKICVIHDDSGLCIGCLRSREEIAVWGRIDNDARARIMAELPARAPRLKARRGGRAGRLARGRED